MIFFEFGPKKVKLFSRVVCSEYYVPRLGERQGTTAGLPLATIGAFV